MRKITTENIDWSKFESKYVKLHTGVEKKLHLANWSEGEWFDKPGVQFDVLFEDGLKVEKKYTVTNRRLLRALQAVVEDAQAQDRKSIWVSILRTGEGFDTDYTVKEIPPLTRVDVEKISDDPSEQIL